jgi:hypothetical protein
VSALNITSSGFFLAMEPGLAESSPIMVPEITTSLMPGTILDSVRRSPKVTPAPPESFFSMAAQVASACGSIGASAVPEVTKSLIRFITDTVIWARMKFSSLSPLSFSGTLSPPFTSGSMFTSFAAWVKFSADMPAASMAAVMEPTEAPWMDWAPSSTPLSCRAFTAPGSAAPFPPPPEKVISLIGGFGQRNWARPSAPTITSTRRPSGPTWTLGVPVGVAGCAAPGGGGGPVAGRGGGWVARVARLETCTPRVRVIQASWAGVLMGCVPPLS